MASNAKVHTLMNWLEDHRDQSLLIHKPEQEDSDHERIRLTGVDSNRRRHRLTDTRTRAR